MPSSDSQPAWLFAVCLGGRARGCNVELHDVVFAVGRCPEDLHGQLLDRWFGQPEGLHLDAWVRLDRVPGYRVALGKSPQAGGPKLYFVNIGGYARGEFGERHAYGFYAGSGKSEVKAKARRELLEGKLSVHRDDLFDIDEVIEVEAGQDWHIQLHADPDATAPEVINGYFPIPNSTIRSWIKRQGR